MRTATSETVPSAVVPVALLPAAQEASAGAAAQEFAVEVVADDPSAVAAVGVVAADAVVAVEAVVAVVEEGGRLKQPRVELNPWLVPDLLAD